VLLCVCSVSVCGRVQVPLQRPGFYPVSLTNFVACVPPSACSGIDAGAVASVYGRLRAGNDSSDVASEELLGIMAGHLQVSVGGRGFPLLVFLNVRGWGFELRGTQAMLVS
jgi:hypothetical protein